MRFRIETSWNQSRPYRVCVPEGRFEVRRPMCPSSFDSADLNWTWCCGTDYSLRYPVHRRGRTATWWISGGGRAICSGRLVIPTLRDAILRWKFPFIEWEFEGRSLVSEESGWCSGGLIRERNANRLAVWRPRGRGWDGICRADLGTTFDAVVIGMILASIHDD
jgi:hypothetical protein